MSKLDFHIHSVASDDGEYTPQEIVTMCREQGMELVAITDHNSVRSVTAAMDAVRSLNGGGAKAAENPSVSGNFRVIPGVELDCTHEGRNFHLLGYGFDHRRKEFAQIEEDILEQEKKAAVEKIRLFRKVAGIPVDEDEVLAASPDGVVPGELIAEILLAKKDARQYEILWPYLPGGAKSDMPNVRFYWDFFSEGKPAYVPIRYISFAGAASMIHDAGGMTVLAHPGQNLGMDETELLNSLLFSGIDGIEAFSSYHSQAAAAYYVEVAEKNHLLITCGSDFHGKHKPAIRIGGHGAFWEDERIMNGILQHLP